MQSAFERLHTARILGLLTTVDRLINPRSHEAILRAQGFVGFLLRQRIRPSGFGE
jgi:hypothetical protein